MPPEALPYFADVLKSTAILKVAHNGRHDRHALENIGYPTDGFVDTLDLVRLAYPERSLDKTKGYRLKPLAKDLLAKPVRDEYDDIIMGVATVMEDSKICACGVEKCKLRKLPAHAKSTVQVPTEKAIEYALRDISPGHPHWLRLLDYAAADAVDALELYDLALRRLRNIVRPRLPW